MKSFRKLLVSFTFLLPLITYAAVTVTVNGSNHTIPQTNERGWGNAVTAWIQAISANTLQPTGGSFTLTADADFGANYGLKAPYYLSRTANPSSAGLFRLAKTDYLGWRNNANSGNLLLAIDASDNLTFNGNVLATTSSSGFVDTGFFVVDAVDATKKMGVNAGGTTGTATTLTFAQTANRAVTFPDATDTLVGKATTDTLTNKTLTSPVINTPTGIVKGDVGLGNVDNTSDATKNAATVTLTNKTIDGDDNTLQDIALTSLKQDFTDTNKFLNRNAFGIVVSSAKDIPTGAVLGTTDAQVVTNKDIDGGTASNTLRLTVPKNTKANLDALTRKAATVVYGTDTNKLYADNGTILKAIGGSFEIVANAAQTNATTLTPGSGSAQVLQISGNGGAVTLTDLGVTNAQDGDQLILAGTSDTNTVTLVPATNTVMNGGATLGDGNMITFLYFNSKYREQSRNF